MVPANPRLQNTLTRSFCRAKARSGWMAGMSQRKRIHLRCVRLRVWYFRIRTTRSLRASWRRMSASDRKISACRRMRSGSDVEESLGAVGMLSYRHHSPNKLSGGQEAARGESPGSWRWNRSALCSTSRLPCLIRTGWKEVIRTVHELNRKKGVTIILITHYMEEVVDATR